MNIQQHCLLYNIIIKLANLDANLRSAFTRSTNYAVLFCSNTLFACYFLTFDTPIVYFIFLTILSNLTLFSINSIQDVVKLFAAISNGFLLVNVSKFFRQPQQVVSSCD